MYTNYVTCTHEGKFPDSKAFYVTHVTSVHIIQCTRTSLNECIMNEHHALQAMGVFKLAHELIVSNKSTGYIPLTIVVVPAGISYPIKLIPPGGTSFCTMPAG